ncbi:MAG: hypothetical protein ACOX81_09925 [Candidatus Heteroscillospira sp.]|jgi:hypothetical protein
MKMKPLKIAALLLALALIIGLGIFANALVGNPISKMLAERTAEKYLSENFPDTDFYIESVGFSFKDGSYYAHIDSPGSMDSYFSLCITMGGALKYDTYDSVIDGSNTARRLNSAYRELADTVLESTSFPYPSEIAFGDLAFTSREYLGLPDVPPYALIEDELVLDKLYDIPSLGAEAGHLVIYVDDDTVSPERASEIMLDIKRLMDEGGVPFYAMDFVLRHPRAEPDGSRPEGSIHVLDFPSADIYEEDMVSRVTAADADARAYYAALDAEK